VLLISPVLADATLPLCSQPALADRYQLIRYHKRGWLGSTHTPPPVSIGDHAFDAAALLDGLGVPCAHVAGHSSGAAVATQLALDHPEKVQSLVLLELTLLSLPRGQAFLEGAEPVFEAYDRGDHAGALALFLTAVSGLDWPTCRGVLEEHVPGAVENAIKDADTFFGVELPALAEWAFDAERAASIGAPILSVMGADTGPIWVEIADFLRSSLPQVEECTIEGVGHLLQIQHPEAVARGMAEFLGRNSMTGDDAQSGIVPPNRLDSLATPSGAAPRG
jgi:pimeloyl-ACP methyl ester carboxylesterase